MSETAADAPAFPTPRVGGGTTADTVWTGDSNVMSSSLNHPKSLYDRRPTDFCSAEKVEYACKKGLAATHHLGADREKEYPITLTSWIDVL